MFSKRQWYFSILFISLVCSSVTAQNQTSSGTQISAPEFNIIINRQAVRFASPAQVQEWRVEVYSQTGELVFSTGTQSSSELEWPLLDQSGKPVESGLYAYTLTIKEQAGEGTRVERGHVIVDRASDADRIWVTSDRAAGIGTGGDKRKLTVAGTSGTTVGGAEVSEAAGKSPADTPHVRTEAIRSAAAAAADGTGTTGRIAKWVGSATLGNSIIAESNGNIGIGTLFPGSRLQILASTGDGVNSSTSVGGTAAGVRGVNRSSGNGVAGQSSSGIGVRGDSTSGAGVYGQTGTGYAAGVWGESTGGIGGVYGRTNTGNAGVYGVNSTLDGVFGITYGGSGATGVRGAHNGAGNGVGGVSGSGIGVRGESTSGTGVSGFTGGGLAGVSGEHTGSGAGVLGKSSNGVAMRAEGNTQQSRDKGGWAKAIYHRNGSAPSTCFRGDENANPATANTCTDFRIFTDVPGEYVITFPFNVRDRFIVITPEWEGGPRSVATANYSFFSPNQVSVRTWVNGDPTWMTFTVLVF